MDSATFQHDFSLIPRSAHFFSTVSHESDSKGPPDPQTFSLFTTADGRGVITLSLEGNVHLGTLTPEEYHTSPSLQHSHSMTKDASNNSHNSHPPPFPSVVPLILAHTPDCAFLSLLHSTRESLALSLIDTRRIASSSVPLQMLHTHITRLAWLSQRFAGSLHALYLRYTQDAEPWRDIAADLIANEKCMLFLFLKHFYY